MQAFESVSTWRQPVPPPVSPARSALIADVVLLGIAFWAIGARNVRRGLLAPAAAGEAEPRRARRSRADPVWPV